ncbi:MAG: DUF4157 domain-containing protein [Candidatus Marinimicrobia bacterium]|nr:DUF4157 domain-containing protein [Candidatus Neomarinimicrobiota bacterium]
MKQQRLPENEKTEAQKQTSRSGQKPRQHRNHRSNASRENVIGNHGMLHLIEQKGFEISQPDSSAEREARAVSKGQRSLRASGARAGASGEEHPEINQIAGPGRYLSADERAHYESEFKTDLSRVKLHTGAKASQAAESINARAFTLGNHVVLGNSEEVSAEHPYSNVLSHELAHVVQNQISPDPGSVIHRQEENPTGTVLTSEGEQEIEGMTVTAPSHESINQRLAQNEGNINVQIDSWVDESIGDVKDGIQSAGASFKLWHQQRERKPNSAEFVFDVVSAAVGVIGAAYPPAGVAAAVVAGLLSVSKGPVSQSLDPNAEPDAMAQRIEQNMLRLGEAIEQRFNNFGATLKVKNPEVWNSIGVAITMDPPVLQIAREKLYEDAGLPRPNEPYAERILSQMIYAYLDWEQQHELESSTFFVSSESVEYAFFTENVRKQLREQARQEAQSRLGTSE